MHDVTLVILNSLRIKCHIRRPLKRRGSHCTALNLIYIAEGAPHNLTG